jgi:hypothetical protein
VTTRAELTPLFHALHPLTLVRVSPASLISSMDGQLAKKS